MFWQNHRLDESESIDHTLGQVYLLEQVIARFHIQTNLVFLHITLIRSYSYWEQNNPHDSAKLQHCKLLLKELCLFDSETLQSNVFLRPTF